MPAAPRTSSMKRAIDHESRAVRTATLASSAMLFSNAMPRLSVVVLTALLGACLALPAAALTALRPHLTAHVGSSADALVFTGDKGGLLRASNFRRAVKWSAVLKAAGLPSGFTFHDLRHTGNTLASASGASTRELMHRMGHASMRAALIYQHATSQRDQEIAAGMDRRIAKETRASRQRTGRRGTRRAEGTKG